METFWHLLSFYICTQGEKQKKKLGEAGRCIRATLRCERTNIF
jgi:hypothetical protein